jgi:single-strand DNA-binding protein
MNEFYIEGKLIKIDDTQEITEKFKKRDFVISTDSQYPEEIKFEVINNNVNYLDSFNVDDNVKISFIIKGSKYNERHYVNLRAIAIGEVLNSDSSNNNIPLVAKMKSVITQVDATEDDLPF